MGKVSDCTKTNISNMIKGEMGSNKMKVELEELYTFIDHASRDEARHGKAFEGLLKRYFA